MIPLDPDTLAALRTYAAHRGRTWKAALLRAWEASNAGVPELQRLRNTHGPAWLARFRLPAG
jgi:hypothetical protein